MLCEDCGYVSGRDDDGWCPWCEAPIDPAMGWRGALGWLLAVVGCVLFWWGLYRLLT